MSTLVLQWSGYTERKQLNFCVLYCVDRPVKVTGKKAAASGELSDSEDSDDDSDDEEEEVLASPATMEWAGGRWELLPDYYYI